MFRIPYALSLLALALPTSADSALPVSEPTAEPDRAADLRCAATIAIAAAEQDRGNPAALSLPPLANRGRRYFALVGNQLVAATGQSREQVRDTLAAEALAQRKAGAADPAATLATAFTRCQPRLDAAIPPLIVPDLLQCTALAALGATDLRASEGDTAAVRSLDAVAFALAGRERRALADAGNTAQQAETALAAAKTAMARALLDEQGGGLEKYDFDHCAALAEPPRKSHE